MVSWATGADEDLLPGTRSSVRKEADRCEPLVPIRRWRVEYDRRIGVDEYDPQGTGPMVSKRRRCWTGLFIQRLFGIAAYPCRMFHSVGHTLQLFAIDPLTRWKSKRRDLGWAISQSKGRWPSAAMDSSRGLLTQRAMFKNNLLTPLSVLITSMAALVTFCSSSRAMESALRETVSSTCEGKGRLTPCTFASCCAASTAGDSTCRIADKAKSIRPRH